MELRQRKALNKYLLPLLFIIIHGENIYLERCVFYHCRIHVKLYLTFNILL